MFDLENKKLIKVAVVETAASVRQMQVDTLRGLGFDSIQSFCSGKEALGYLEVESLDWLIMPSLESSKINAVQILKIISENGRLRNLRTSLILDLSAELYLLSVGFELGLMSYHPKTFSKDEFESSFTDLFTMFSMNAHDAVLVAAQYCTTFLQKVEAKKSILSFSETILKMYPGKPKILLNLAAAQFLNGRDAAAEITLQQVVMLEPKLKSPAMRLLQKFTKKTDLDAVSSGDSTNILGIKTAVIIDPDITMMNQIEAVLLSCGVKTVEKFKDGDEAWNWIKDQPEPGIIIQEWRIAKVSGPMLIQRIRSHGYVQVPIIVTSSLLEKEDGPLLLEMGVDKIIKKPFLNNNFISAIVWTLQERSRPRESKSIEQKVRRFIKIGKIPDALRLMTHFMDDERVPPHKKLQLQAEFQFATGHVLEAKNLCAKIIEDGEANVLSLNLLGRILLELKDFSSAFAALERAHAICPMNIERLAKMADIKIQTGDISAAKDFIEAAEAFDSGAETVKEASCHFALETGDIGKASDLFSELDSAVRVISYMNNRAVAQARIGHFEDGIAMYQKTIKALPIKMEEERLAVNYNLALAYARYGDYDKSIKTLQKISSTDGRIGKKSAVLQKRLEKAVEQGACIEFKESSHEEVLAKTGQEDVTSFDLSTQAMLDSLSVDPGDLCCYKIFFFLEGHDERCELMLRDMPRFVSREKIERERTNTDMRTA
jgi:DNA-binding response OmpR family regulator